MLLPLVAHAMVKKLVESKPSVLHTHAPLRATKSMEEITLTTMVTAMATNVTPITTAITSSNGRKPDNWRTALIVVCGVLGMAMLVLGGIVLQWYSQNRYVSPAPDTEEYAAHTSL